MIADERAVKRHWHLAVWEVPGIGSFSKVSTFTWSKKRAITVPELNAAKQQRKVPDGSTLINVAYIGHMNQYELTGISPDPVPTTTSPAFCMGLEQVMLCPDPEQLLNAFPEDDEFNHHEWLQGKAQGLLIRSKNQAAAHALAAQNQG